MLEQNNRSWAGDDVVIYQSWCVIAMCNLHPLTLWPRELIVVIVRVTVVEEVVTYADEMM
jgi:hypothetical protein